MTTVLAAAATPTPTPTQGQSQSQSQTSPHAPVGVPASTAPGSAAPTRKPGSGRDQFLDSMRAIALVRVVVWHTFAAAPISWVVASMPTMFFIAGSLLAHSLDRKDIRAVLTSRLRRLLVPFWVYGGVVLTVLVVVHQVNPSPQTRMAPTSLIAWVFPVVDPHGSRWEAGWVSTPLWYLRCYLWLMLLSPVLRTLHRRMGLSILLFPAAGVFVVDWLIRHPEVAPAGFASVKWYVGDLCTYSFFWLLGFCHRDGLVAGIDRRGRLEWAAIGGAAAVIWLKTVGVPTMVVNDSYPLLLFVGITWLGLFLSAERWLGNLATADLTGPVVRWLGRRAITVYLWHPVAIVGAYWIRATLAPDLPLPALLPIIAVLAVLLAVVFGRAEDAGAQRPGQWWPGPSRPGPDIPWPARLSQTLDRRLGAGPALLLGAVLASMVLGTVVPVGARGSEGKAPTKAGTTGNLALPPAPSGKPDTADFGGGGSDATPSAPAATPSTPAPASGAPAGGAEAGAGAMKSKLLAATDAWRAAKRVDGAQVGVGFPDGTRILLASGSAPGGKVWTEQSPFPVTSVTKTMTATIILKLVAAGKISLDDPLPTVAKVPDLPYAGKVTIRQILNHTAGIQPYDKTPGYAAARANPLTPVSALRLVVPQPLEWTPGTQVGYSNSGYLTLGLLAEQVSGRTYQELLTEHVFGPAGLTRTRLDDTPTAGWAGFSAGGVVSTPDDLISWGDALYRAKKILPPAMLAEMLNIDNKFSSGLGAFPTCPCSTVNGTKVYGSIGHNGGQCTLQYAPAENLVIAINLTESLWTAELSQADVAALVSDLRGVAAGSR